MVGLLLVCSGFYPNMGFEHVCGWLLCLNVLIDEWYVKLDEWNLVSKLARQWAWLVEGKMSEINGGRLCTPCVWWNA